MTTYESWISESIRWHAERVSETTGRLRRKNLSAMRRLRNLLLWPK